MSVPGNLLMVLLAAGAFAMVGAAAVAAMYPFLRSVIAGLPPAPRARAVLWCCAVPVLAAATLTAACLAPSIGTLVGLGADHCLVHDDHHAHLCLLHAAGASLTPAGWAGLLAFGGWWIASAVPEMLRVAVGSRQLWRLERVAPPRADGIRLVQSAAPVAFAGGILRPRVYISAALVGRLSAPQVQALTEHEWAHVRRRDGLWKLVASILCATHLPAVRRALLADLALACEQACDAAAAERVGDRVEVAGAIVAAERVLAGWQAVPVGGWPFVGSNVAARVDALLAEPAARGTLALRWVAGLVALAGLALVLAGDSLHHATETLVAHLVR